MTNQVINVGTSPNSRTGDTLRTAFIKINENFDQVFNNLTVLNGSQDPNSVVDLNIKGSVFGLDGSVIVDAITGKLSVAALPSNSPLSYSITARFDSVGDLISADTYPAGWTIAISNNVLTITGLTKPPMSIAYWGYTDAGELRLRYPTPGYQAIIKPDLGYQLELYLNTAVTGATSDQYAIIKIVL